MNNHKRAYGDTNQARTHFLTLHSSFYIANMSQGEAKTILNRKAAATPQAIIFLLFSVANPAAIKPIMIALSAAITISIRIICIEIITCSNINRINVYKVLRIY